MQATPDVLPKPMLDTTTEKINIRNFYIELAWMAFPFAMEWYYLSVYAIALGATAAHLGTLTAGRALLLAVGSGLANRWGSRYRNSIRALAVPLFTARLLLYLGVALVPLLPAYQMDVMVGLVLLSALPGGISQGVFLGMLPTAISEHKLAGVVARRSMLMNLTVLIGVLLAGQLLERLAKPTNYQIGFMLAFLASAISCWYVQRIRTADTVNVKTRTHRVNVWKDVSFRRFSIIVLAVNISVFIAAPLVPLQLVKGLHSTDSWISIFGMFEMAAGALFTLRIAALIRRFGTRNLIIATTLATLFQVLILSLTTTLPPFIIGEILFGAGWFAVNVLLYNRLVEIVPPEDMGEYAAIYTMLINVALFAGPLIGTFLIEHGMSTPTALLLIAGLRLTAGFLAWAIRVNPAPRRVAMPSEVVEALA